MELGLFVLGLCFMTGRKSEIVQEWELANFTCQMGQISNKKQYCTLLAGNNMQWRKEAKNII